MARFSRFLHLERDRKDPVTAPSPVVDARRFGAPEPPSTSPAPAHPAPPHQREPAPPAAAPEQRAAPDASAAIADSAPGSGAAPVEQPLPPVPGGLVGHDFIPPPPGLRTDLELERSEVGTPGRKCALCSTENGGFDPVCAGCGTDLTTDEQQAFNAEYWQRHKQQLAQQAKAQAAAKAQVDAEFERYRAQLQEEAIRMRPFGRFQLWANRWLFRDSDDD